MKKLTSLAALIFAIICLITFPAFGQNRRRSRSTATANSKQSDKIPRLQLDAEQKLLVCAAMALRLRAHKIYTQVGANDAFGQANVAANDATVRAMKRIPDSQLKTVLYLMIRAHDDLRSLVTDEQFGFSVSKEIVRRYELDKHPREEWQGVIANNAKSLFDIAITLMKASNISKC